MCVQGHVRRSTQTAVASAASRRRPDFQLFASLVPGAMASTPSSTEITAAVSTLQAALDSGVDLAIHFGGWTRLQRRTLAMALGASEAAYADA